MNTVQSTILCSLFVLKIYSKEVWRFKTGKVTRVTSNICSSIFYYAFGHLSKTPAFKFTITQKFKKLEYDMQQFSTCMTTGHKRDSFLFRKQICMETHSFLFCLESRVLFGFPCPHMCFSPGPMTVCCGA